VKLCCEEEEDDLVHWFSY